MVIQYYYGYGDSFTYFKGSNFYTDRFNENPENIKYLFASQDEVSKWYNSHSSGEELFSGYFGNPANNMVMKISAIFSYLGFNRFLIVALFFAFFSFMGQWKLFLVFDDVNKQMHRKLIAFAVLYSPSIWFWGSGLSKDSICVGALGMIIYVLYNAIIKKKINLTNFLVLLFSFWLITVIKSYITAVVLASLVILFLMVFIKGIKNFIVKMALTISLLGIGVILLIQLNISEIIQESVTEVTSLVNNFQQGYQATDDGDNSKGGIAMVELDASLSSLLLRSPGIILTCLYRPFIWESRSIMIFFTAFESLLLLIFTIYLLFKTRIIHFFKLIFGDYYLFFCFVLSILFALVIGFTTFNFGTMIRYKVIFLPFFYFMIIRIFSFVKYKDKMASAAVTSPVL